MTDAPENPAAFPAAWTETNEHGISFPFVQGGMTLRDWFAGRALAFLADPNVQDQPAGLARAAYAIADAMLAERAKVSHD